MPPSNSETWSSGWVIGLAMLKLIDPEQVSASLLGAVLSMLIRAAEADPQVRELLADPDRLQESEQARVS